MSEFITAWDIEVLVAAQRWSDVRKTPGAPRGLLLESEFALLAAIAKRNKMQGAIRSEPSRR